MCVRQQTKEEKKEILCGLMPHVINFPHKFQPFLFPTPSSFPLYFIFFLSFYLHQIVLLYHLHEGMRQERL